MLGTREERTTAELESLSLSLTKINMREQLKASEVENILEELKAAAFGEKDSERLLACLRLARNLVGGAHTNADLAVQFFSSSFDLWVGVLHFLLWYATSVADPGCLSRFLDLGSRIQKHQQKRGVKKNLLSYLLM
jgi:hypothetical protein